jgi:hypothetical protein
MSSAVVNVATSIPITLYDADGVGRAGLTVTSVARKAGSATTVSATSVPDRSNGDYDALFTFPSVGTWRVTSTATIDGQTATDLTDVEVETAAQADPASVFQAGSISVATAVTPSTLRLTLIRGSDYLNADGTALAWTVTSPSLVGATATLRIFTYAGVTVISKAMTISGTTVRADLTSTETAALSLGTPAYKYTIIAVLSGGSHRTLGGIRRVGHRLTD